MNRQLSVPDLEHRRRLEAILAALEDAVGDTHPHEFRFLNLRPIAESAGLQQRDLVALSRKGQFAPVIPVTERIVLILEQDLRAWLATSRITPAREDAIRGHMDTTPAEPFAEVEPASVKRNRKAGER